MVISILAIAKTKKSFIKEGLEHYETMLKKYSKLEWIYIEASREQLPENQVKE